MRVRVCREKPFATIEVENTGRLIPAHLRATIFDPFQRATNRSGGVGLGLYITRQIGWTVPSAAAAKETDSFSLVHRAAPRMVDRP